MSLVDSRLKERGTHVLQTKICWHRLSTLVLFIHWGLWFAPLLPGEASQRFDLVVHHWFIGCGCRLGFVHHSRRDQASELRRKAPISRGFSFSAETRGFEPPNPFQGYLISSEAHSTGLCDVSKYLVSLADFFRCSNPSRLWWQSWCRQANRGCLRSSQ